MVMYLIKKIKSQVKVLIFDKAPIIVMVKYSNYNKIFSIKNIMKILEYTKINNYAIKLKKD